MKGQTKPADPASGPTPAPRRAWMTFEAAEVIELKRIAQDRDRNEAVDFFRGVLVPRVLEAARRRGIPVDVTELPNDGRIP